MFFQFLTGLVTARRRVTWKRDEMLAPIFYSFEHLTHYMTATYTMRRRIEAEWGDSPIVLDWFLMFFQFLTGLVTARRRVTWKRDEMLAPSFYSFEHLTHYMTAIGPNVRRYVLLAQSRGGACFCTRGAVQDYAVITLFSRWQKP